MTAAMIGNVPLVHLFSASGKTGSRVDFWRSAIQGLEGNDERV